MTFKQGDLLIFIPITSNKYVAKPGSLAIVTTPPYLTGDKSYVEVKWVCELGGYQMDGAYYEKDFIPFET